MAALLRLSKNYKMQSCDRAAGNGPGQLLLPFGQFTFRVKGAKSPFRVQSSSFLNFSSSESWTAAGRKDFFDTLFFLHVPKKRFIFREKSV